jgi:hypothetical protein
MSPLKSLERMTVSLPKLLYYPVFLNTACSGLRFLLSPVGVT